MKKIHSKRALSTVVTTLILILLVLVAIGIIWVVVSNLIEAGADQIDIGRITVDLEIQSVEYTATGVDTTIERNMGAGELAGIKIIYEGADGESPVTQELTTADAQLQEGGTGTFDFDFTTGGLSYISKVSVAPIFETQSGSTSTGNVVDSTTQINGVDMNNEFVAYSAVQLLAEFGDNDRVELVDDIVPLPVPVFNPNSPAQDNYYLLNTFQGVKMKIIAAGEGGVIYGIDDDYVVPENFNQISGVIRLDDGLIIYKV